MPTATLPRHRWGDPQSRAPRPLNNRPSIAGRHIFLACLLLGAVIAGTMLFIAEYGGVEDSYSATIEGIFPVGSSQVGVGIEVTNLGNSSATPTCRIEMNSPDRFVTGTGTFKANHPILGGSRTYFEMMIPVTTYGASRVTFGASNVSCQ
jgi:hypothetical protein